MDILACHEAFGGWWWMYASHLKEIKRHMAYQKLANTGVYVCLWACSRWHRALQPSAFQYFWVFLHRNARRLLQIIRIYKNCADPIWGLCMFMHGYVSGVCFERSYFRNLQNNIDTIYYNIALGVSHYHRMPGHTCRVSSFCETWRCRCEIDWNRRSLCSIPCIL